MAVRDCGSHNEIPQCVHRLFIRHGDDVYSKEIFQEHNRLLYGTDWYMGRCFWTEKSYLKWFTTYSRRIPWSRVKFTGEEIKRMTEDNPGRFLGFN